MQFSKVLSLFTQKQDFWTQIFWMQSKSRLKHCLKMRFFELGLGAIYCLKPSENRACHSLLPINSGQKKCDEMDARIYIHRIRRNTEGVPWMGFITIKINLSYWGTSIPLSFSSIRSHSRLLIAFNSFFFRLVFPSLYFFVKPFVQCLFTEMPHILYYLCMLSINIIYVKNWYQREIQVRRLVVCSIKTRT